MRKLTGLSDNCRGMARSANGWGTTSIHHGTIQGGPGEMVPTALAVLAASESVLIFWLVKQSGCRTGEDADERADATEHN